MAIQCSAIDGTPCSANQLLVIARWTMLLPLILHGPFRLRVASFTSFLPIPRPISLRRLVRGLPHCFQ